MKYIYYALYDVCYISDQPSGLSVELISERSLKCLPGAGVVHPHLLDDSEDSEDDSYTDHICLLLDDWDKYT